MKDISETGNDLPSGANMFPIKRNPGSTADGNNSNDMLS